MNKKLIPVMLCFFAMGFVDMVGIASNYVKEDLALSDAMANTLFACLLLVPYLQYSHESADEQDWQEEHGSAEPCDDACGNACADVHR